MAMYSTEYPAHAPNNGRRGGLIVLGLGLLLMAALVAWLVLRPPPPPLRAEPEVLAIKVLPPPPPPPPQPQPQTPVPQTQAQVVDVPRLDQPEFKQETAAADDQSPAEPGPLGVDGAGSGSGDAFGLIGGGSSGWDGSGHGSGTGSGYAWYSALLKSQAQQAIQKSRRLTSRRYEIAVQVWIGANGEIERVELMDSTGRPDLDAALQDALLGIRQLSRERPAEMPQPVVIRVTSL